MVKEQSVACFTYYGKRQNSFEGQTKRELSIGMAHLFLSENSDEEFDYRKDGIIFDWNEFEKNVFGR